MYKCSLSHISTSIFARSEVWKLYYYRLTSRDSPHKSHRARGRERGEERGERRESERGEKRKTAGHEFQRTKCNSWRVNALCRAYMHLRTICKERYTAAARERERWGREKGKERDRSYGASVYVTGGHERCRRRLILLYSPLTLARAVPSPVLRLCPSTSYTCVHAAGVFIFFRVPRCSCFFS